MGKRKKTRKQKTTAQSTGLIAKYKTIDFPNLAYSLNISIREGCYLMSWEELLHILNIPSSNADISIYGMVNRTRDGRILNGEYIKTADNKFKIFLNPTGFSSYIYRGENMEYEHFEPSLQRAIRKKETKKLQTTKNFITSLKKCPIYKCFNQPVQFGNEYLTFDIDAEAIAQHYGFTTNYLDLTRDENIAKFFAYTYFDEKTNKYKLIENYKYYSPTLYRAHITDIYNKYGCEPIGFQPFLRPIKQWALAVNLGVNYKGIKNLFEVQKLFDIEEAKNIYDNFKGGELLFPKEPLTIFIEKYYPSFSTTMDWDANYVKLLLMWLSENIGWINVSHPPQNINNLSL